MPRSVRVNVCTLVTSGRDLRCARLMVEGLRAFGGPYGDARVRALVSASAGAATEPASPMPAVATRMTAGGARGKVEVTPALAGAEAVRFEPDSRLPRYPFAAKVAACAEAERLAGADGGTLVWLSPHCLVVNPPDLLELAPPFRAAFRAVHISNVGSPADEPPDDYWRAIYDAVGLEDAPFSVESFVDGRSLRPYFNTHLFSVDPSIGLMAEWRERFEEIVADNAFQCGPCRDKLRRIFLHQAVLCALLTKRLLRGEIRELPAAYSYPLHFHDRVPSELRPDYLDQLVCPVYEEDFRYPATLGGIGVREPLESWLAEHGSKT